MRESSILSEKLIASSLALSALGWIVTFAVIAIYTRNPYELTVPSMGLIVVILSLLAMVSVDASFVELKEVAVSLRARRLSAEQAKWVESLLLFMSLCPLHWRVIVSITPGLVSTAFAGGATIAAIVIPITLGW